MGPLEIAVDAFERELRDGAPIAVVDVRTPEDVARWHVDTAGAPFVNVPEDRLADAPAATLALLPEVPLRVVCARGTASLRVVRRLRDAGFDALSVAGGTTAWGLLLVADEVPVAGAATLVQLRREARGCLSYLVVSDGEALVVDPAPTVQPYLDAAARHGARITRVLDTHVHADHLSGARDVAAATGATLHLSSAAVARGATYVELADAVDDGDRLALGSADVRILALPGHTTDMVGVVVDDRALIGGDSLFADGVARPDLEVGSDGAAAMARQLLATIRERILPLGDDVVLLPCHYPGGRLAGPVAPTLREVRRAVPTLELEPDAFAAAVLAAMPPRPANYVRIIAANLGREVGDSSTLEVGGNSCAAAPRAS